jgi:hypothetical protein
LTMLSMVTMLFRGKNLSLQHLHVNCDRIKSCENDGLVPHNPEASIERFGYTYRVGDRVLQTENNYGKDVFNGDLGGRPAHGVPRDHPRRRRARRNHRLRR